MPITLQIHHPDRMVVGLVRGAASGLTAFSQRMHSLPLPPQRGPIALVANDESAPLAKLFVRPMGDDRPVEVFASIHAARQWLYANSKIS